MATIKKNEAPTIVEMENFIKHVNFNLPEGFVSFFGKANGAEISTADNYISLWPLMSMMHLNKEYNVEEYAPEFFIFGSDGGDTAFAIEKSTGYIHEMPFIGMSREEAIFKAKTFTSFIDFL